MLISDFLNAYSLRYNVHVLFVFLQSTLMFAREIAEQDAPHLSEEDRQLYDDLADYLERASFEAGKIKTLVHRVS